jgi:hypothetical protein
MNLYQINQEIESLINEETGEITDLEKLQQLNIDKDVKIENIALFIKNLEAETMALDSEIKNLQERKSSKNKKVDSLKKYLSTFMQSENKTKFETPKVKLDFRKSTALKIEDEEVLMLHLEAKIPELLKTKVTKSVDKKGLKEFLKTEEINGCYLEEKQNLQIK